MFSLILKKQPCNLFYSKKHSIRGGSRKILRVRKFVISQFLEIDILISRYQYHIPIPQNKKSKKLFLIDQKSLMYFVVEIDALNYFDFLYNSQLRTLRTLVSAPVQLNLTV